MNEPTSPPTEPVKRKWVYVLTPAKYGMSGCDCGNNECQWSEFEKHLWCAKCQKDFIPKETGMFDGPIGLEVCRMLGIVFDRYEISSGRIVKFSIEANGQSNPEWDKTWP